MQEPNYTYAFSHNIYSSLFQCSVYECGEVEWNYKQVRKFKSHHGQPGQMFPCFYDPVNPKAGVIVERTEFITMLHGLLWPCACVGLGGFLWLGLCLGWWRLDRNLPEHELYRKI